MRAREASPAQQRFWLLEQLASVGDPVRIVPSCVRLDGPLDIGRLRAALQAVIDRHEVLRSTYRWSSGALVADVDRHRPIEIPEAGSRVAATYDEAAAVRYVQQLASTSMDLTQGPVLRVALLANGPRQTYLALAAHHIVWDGWSTTVLLRDLGRAYDGGPNSLPALEVDYWTYADRKRRSIDEERGLRELAYWHTRLQGIEQLPPLARPSPADDAIPQVRNARLELDPRLTAKISAFAGSHDATPFSVVVAGLQALLRRCGLGTDSCLGIALADRMEDRRFEGLIGCFLNTVALRGSTNDADTFEQLSARVRDAAFEAVAHGALPFEVVVQRLALKRNIYKAPLYQALLSFQNFPHELCTVGEAEATTIAIPGIRGRAEAAIFVEFEGPAPALQIEWSGELAIPVDRLLGGWRAVLDAAMGDPHAMLDTLPSTPPPLAEARWDGRPTAAVAGEQTPRSSTTIPSLLRARAREMPDAPALFNAPGDVSFAELMREVDEVAERLRSIGVEPATMVGLAARRSRAAFVAMLAILDVGGVCVPLDPGYPPERLRFMLSDSGAALLLCAEPDEPAWTDVPTCGLDGSGTARVGSAPEQKHEGIGWVFYTSGSTGRPKGVLIEQRALLARMLDEPIPWRADERCCHRSSPSFGDSIWEMLGPLLNGVPTVIADDETARDARLLSRLIEQAGVTRILVVPSLLGTLLTLPPEGLTRLAGIRCWIASGEPLPGALARRLYDAFPDTTLVNVYGATECWEVSWHLVPRSICDGDTVPIGGPLFDGVRAWIVDERLVPVPAGASGELVVGGRYLARGYLDRPDLTMTRFVDLTAADGETERVYRTGDFARRRADDMLELVGRRDLQVKLRGFRIELEEIERWLLACPGVTDGAVVPQRDVAGTVVGLTAFVVPASGAMLDVTVLRRALGEQLPDYCIPSAWTRLDRMPLMPNAKVDRSALATLAACAPTPLELHSSHRDSDEPGTDRERALVAIWRDLLGVERIGIADDFFELGGNSLLAVQAVIRVQERFGVEIPLHDFHEGPTIAGLIPLLDR